MQIALIYFSEQKLNVMLVQYLTSQGNWLKYGYKNVTSVCYLPNKAKKTFFSPCPNPLVKGIKKHGDKQTKHREIKQTEDAEDITQMRQRQTGHEKEIRYKKKRTENLKHKHAKLEVPQKLNIRISQFH